MGTSRVGRLNSAGLRGFCDGERDFSGAGHVIQERRTQLKSSTVDDVLFLHINLKHHAKHQVVEFPGIPSNVSDFPSVAGRASISIYSGYGRVRNVIAGMQTGSG